MKARILIAFVFIFLVKTNVYSQFTGGVQDGYASGTSIKKIIADTIVVSPIPTLVYCAGAAINIDFFARITFNAGNIFTAQLSDASGSFASPVSLGTLVGTTSGTINGTIPLITPAGIGYRVRVVSSNPFFISQPNASNITVKALPVITASSNSPICEGAALNLTSSLAGADSYSWTGPNTFTDNVQNPTIPAATAAAAGVYNVSATVSGCSNSATSTVVINASPGLALAVSDASICNPAAGNVIITVTNAQIGYLYELRTSGGVALTPAVTGIGTGANLNLTILQANAPAATTTYSVYASIGACTALALTDQPIVSVTAAIPQTITGTTPLCIGATNIYTSTTAGGAWSSGTPANATVNAVSGLVTGVAAGTSIITYSLISGSCTNTATKTVTIDAPIAQTITGTSPLCIGATNIYTSTTPGGAWSSGTPANATVNAVSGLVTGVAAGTSIISYSVVFGACTNTATKTVTIEAPVAQTITGTTPLCIGATNIYTSTTPGGAWSSGTPANATVNAVSGLVTGVAAGTSVITYSVVTGSCTNTATKTVTIQAPVAQTITGTSPLCIGATNIYASTTPGGAWSSGTPVNATVNAVSGLVTGVAAGTSIITYTVVTGVCTNTATKTVTIDAPIAQTITGTSPLCIGATNIYTSTTPGGAWSSGTPANATVNAISGLVTGVAAGTSIITYTVSTGACTNIGTKTVTISSPIAQTITGASPLCVGQTSLYSSTTAGGTWSSGTPANATVDAITGLVTGVAAGTSIINYSVITGACTNTANFTVTVNPSPVITASSNSPLCEGQNLNFNLVAPGATSYIWAGPNSFSDNVQNPTIASITSAAAGIYSVTATIASCSSTTTTTVVVNPLPSLTFVTF
ncbi:MAG: hypothetical protein HXX09_16355, partial [Bacteroidetes bacterium]|nr:hypothetical protein [Bacteroidota bacterium]